MSGSKTNNQTESSLGPPTRFQPADFGDILRHIPIECPMIGGQAVAWWALRFNVQLEGNRPITSEDIDFWGGRDELNHVARSLNLTPIYPHEYEMTVWAGAIQLDINGEKSLADFLHTVPGLDVLSPGRASAQEEFVAADLRKTILILTPVSLILTKLHALRHFPQDNREDHLHLKICLETARAFLDGLLQQGEIRQLFWNIERLVAVHQLKPCRHLEEKLGFRILGAVPIEQMQKVLSNGGGSPDDKRKLARFLATRWPQVTHKDDKD